MLFDVYSENWETLLCFIALATQWRVISGMAVARLGIDYAAIRPVLWAQRVRPSRERDVFTGVQMMEGAALAVFNKSEAGRKLLEILELDVPTVVAAEADDA